MEKREFLPRLSIKTGHFVEKMHYGRMPDGPI